MTNSTMPEALWRGMDNSSECGGEWEAYAKPHKAYTAKYIRADLVKCDSNAPLCAGQFRWVMISDVWEIADVHYNKDHDELYITTIDSPHKTWYVSELTKIGPVIRLPEDA